MIFSRIFVAAALASLSLSSVAAEPSAAEPSKTPTITLSGPSAPAPAGTHALTVFSHDGSFGVVAPGYAGQMLFTIYNMSSKSSVSGIRMGVSGERRSELAWRDDCPKTLAPLQKCKAVVEWAPSSEGRLDARLTVVASDPKIEVSAALEGSSR